MRFGVRAIVAGLLALGPVPAATAQGTAGEPFYKGKQIRLIISAGVAGGDATYARALVQHMPNHMPGKPDMLFQSMLKVVQDAIPAADAAAIVQIPPDVADGPPRYLQIADQIEAGIRSGTLKPGDKLPPQRRLAARLGIDFTTVSRAYAEAASRRLGLKKTAVVLDHVAMGWTVSAAAGAVDITRS